MSSDGSALTTSGFLFFKTNSAFLRVFTIRVNWSNQTVLTVSRNFVSARVAFEWPVGHGGRDPLSNSAYLDSDLH